MNDSQFDQTRPTPEPGPVPQPAGFCQHCGRPLTTETIRQVGPAVYCEPCLAQRLGQSAPGAPAGAAGSVPPGSSGYGPVQQGFAGPFSTTGLNAPGPNPGLAALLGLIPGVGAMYNEQYAKGVVHLIVFAVLVSLSDHVNGIFGLFCFGWICYMAIEAHHTARARRDGTPLPNPFGLNDIGERLGFGRSWPSGPSVTQVASDAAAAAAEAAASFNTRQHYGRTTYPPNPQPGPPAQASAQSAGEPWGAPTDNTSSQAAATHAAYAAQFTQDAYAQAYRDAGSGAVPPFQPVQSVPYDQPAASPYAPMPPLAAYDPAVLAPRPSRFPAGAVWLIGLGIVFLLTTTGVFNSVPAEALTGCVLLGIGVWLFLHRMIGHGTGTLTSDGTPAYTIRLLSALRTSVWVAMLGVLFLLSSFHIMPWRESWTLLVILAGIMALLHRSVYQAAAQTYMKSAPISTASPSAVSPTDSVPGGN